jgi:hypothetical protein
MNDKKESLCKKVLAKSCMEVAMQEIVLKMYKKNKIAQNIIKRKFW